MAVPEVRAAKSTQKTTGTELEPVVPAGTENGDLLLAIVDGFSKNGALATITVPAGWTVEGEEQKDETAENKRTFLFCWREYTGVVGAFKFSATPENSMNVHLVCVKKGTFKKGEPIGAKSAWLKGAASTTQTAPKATSAANGSLPIFLVCSPQAPKEAAPAETWLEWAASQTIPGLDAWSMTGGVGIASGASTGEPTYKKSNTKPGWALMLVIAPAGSATTFERSATESVTVTESVTFNGGNARGATDSASVAETVTRTGNLVRKPTETVSVAESVVAKGGAGREASESFNVAESTARVEGSPRAPEEVSLVEEVVARTAASPRTASESYAVSESVARAEGSPRTPTESIKVAEVATRGAQSSTRPATESVSVAEGTTGVGSFARSSSESIATAESTASLAGQGREATESYSISESAAFEHTQHVQRTLSATATATATLQRSVLRGMAATATPVPSVRRDVGHPLSAQATSVVFLTRQLQRVLSVSQPSVADLERAEVIVQLVLSTASSGPSMLATTTVEPKYEIEVGA